MREPPSFPVPSGQALPEFEPGLLPALAALTEHQRVCVVLVHGYSWPIVEVARLLDVTHATARTHLQRGMAHLRIALEVHRAD
jgi:DNA-directed RNA polymerase specialized sigma24 family protein